jgi:hypothetical protein
MPTSMTEQIQVKTMVTTGLEHVNECNKRLQHIIADQRDDRLQDPGQDPGPPADDIRHHVADIVAYVVAAAAAEDPPKEIADAANHAAHRLHDGVADILKDRCQHIDEGGDEVANLGHHEFDDRDDDLYHSDDRLKDELTKRAHGRHFLDGRGRANICPCVFASPRGATPMR